MDWNEFSSGSEEEGREEEGIAHTVNENASSLHSNNYSKYNRYSTHSREEDSHGREDPSKDGREGERTAFQHS